MRGITQIARKDLRQNLTWYFWWALLLATYSVMLVLSYPGKQGLESLLPILNDPAYSAILGFGGGVEPTYGFWISMVMPFLIITLFACSVIGASRLLLKELDNKTGELLFSLPIKRTTYLFIQLTVALSYQAILWIIVLFPLVFPAQGESIGINTLAKLFVLGMGISFFGSSVGFLIGVIKGEGGVAQQIGLLSLLLLYILQIISRMRPGLKSLYDINPLSWANSSKIILEKQFAMHDFLKYVLCGVAFLALAVIGYAQKDLAGNIDLLFFPTPWKNKRKLAKKKREQLTSKSYASSILVKWVTPFKRSHPFMADFIFSEARVLLIVFFALIGIFPLQILAYKDQWVTEEFRASWSTNPIFRVFSWGHIDIQDPYLWAMGYQTFGMLWIILLPLTLFWPSKILFSDQKNLTGEIIASFPVNSRKILLERQLALLFELVFIWSVSSALLIMSEMIIGKTKFTVWEVYAMLLAIPFYYFMGTSILVAGVLYQRKGALTVQIFYALAFLWFVVELSANAEPKWYHKGYFGLYDPLAIVLERAVFGSNYELIIFSLLSIFSTFLLYKIGNKHSLVN